MSQTFDPPGSDLVRALRVRLSGLVPKVSTTLLELRNHSSSLRHSIVSHWTSPLSRTVLSLTLAQDPRPTSHGRATSAAFCELDYSKTDRSIKPSNRLKGPSDSFAVVSWSLILAVLSTHISIPYARRFRRPLFELSYPNGNGEYLQGSEDALFVLGWLVLMTAIRATIIEGVYQLVTWLHLMAHKERMRFAEQGFLLVYYGTSFALGMVRKANTLSYCPLLLTI